MALALAAGIQLSADGGALVLDVPSCAALMQFNTRWARVYREGEAGRRSEPPCTDGAPAASAAPGGL